MSLDRLTDLLVRLLVKHADVPNEDLDRYARRVRERVGPRIAGLINEQFGEEQLPLPGESVAVSLEQPLVSALIYDRVWLPPLLAGSSPKEFRVYGATDVEVWGQALAISTRSWGIPDAGKVCGELLGVDDAAMASEPLCRLPDARFVAEILFQERGIKATPVYSLAEDRNRDYAAGDHSIVVAAVTDIQLVDEAKLTWEQVAEFRLDTTVRAKYRRLIHWLDSDMIGKPASFVQDEMACRLEDYEAGLRKHGISTLLGSLETVIDPKFVAASSALFAGVLLGSTLPIAATATVGLCAARVACSVARGLLDIDEAKRGPGAEIVFLHEIKKKLQHG